MDKSMNYSDDKQQRDKGSFSSRLASELSNITNALAEQQYQRSFLPLVSLEECIQYFKEESRNVTSFVPVAGFILSVKKNLDPRNENDNYIVVQGLVDSQNKPITVKGESVSRIMHTRTIDDALIRALNGKESAIFRV